MTITTKTVRELLNYDPETGAFIWLVSRKGVNAGDSAGSIDRLYDNRCYINITVYGKKFRAHRLAFLWMTGKWPQYEVDHRDCDGLNNRWHNLRNASRQQNAANARLRKDSSTGFKGVTRHRGRYQAQIKCERKYRYLGMFDTPEEAHDAYLVAAKDLFGEFARAT